MWETSLFFTKLLLKWQRSVLWHTRLCIIWLLNLKISNIANPAGFWLENTDRIKSEDVQADIKKHIIDSREDLISKDIQPHLTIKIGLLLPRYTIMKYLKTELSMIYKKESIFILRTDDQKLFYVNILHVLILGCLINKDTTIVSISKTSFDRSVNNLTAGFTKGLTRRFSWSNSLDPSLSYGNHLRQTIFRNSHVFQCNLWPYLEFIRIMNMWFESKVGRCGAFKIRRSTWQLLHSSKRIMLGVFEKSYPATYMFLSQYSPHIARLS